MSAIPGKKSAFNTLLKADALAGDIAGTYRDVAYIRSIKGPGLALDVVDVTSHDSTGAWEELVATILRTGEVTLDIIYDPAAVTIKYVNGLLGKMAAKTLEGFKIYFNTDTVEASRAIWVFNAYITGFEPDMPFDGALTASMKLKISGAPTIV
jgi:predicted secreted protein